jgi:hypothetical protein
VTRDNRDPDDSDPRSWFADESDPSYPRPRPRREAVADPSSAFPDESDPLSMPGATGTSGAGASAGLRDAQRWLRLLRSGESVSVVGVALTMALFLLWLPTYMPEPARSAVGARNGTETWRDPRRRVPAWPAAAKTVPPAAPQGHQAGPVPDGSAAEHRRRAAPSPRPTDQPRAPMSARTSASPVAPPLPTPREAPPDEMPSAVPLATSADTGRSSTSPGPAALPLPAAESGSAVPLDALLATAAAPPADDRAAALNEAAVRRTLGEYVEAYEGLDVPATVKIWPAVNRQALGRAFAALTSQALAFDTCDLDVAEPTAVAHCRGTLRFVRRVGNPTPRVEPQQWTFRLRKLGTAWKIEQVLAGPAPGSSAQHVDGPSNVPRR